MLKTVDNQDPVAIRAREVMERQVSHLVRLVDDLLEVSRITRGSIEVQPGADRSRLRHPLGDRHQPAGDRRGRPPADRRSPRRADRRLRRHRPAHAGLRQPAQQRGQVHQRRRPHPDRAPQGWDTAPSSSVRDNGIGIAADQLASVFEMFTQVDRSNRLAQGGLGIGLTLVRSLVAMHGGHRGGAQRRPGHRQRVRRRAPGARPRMRRPTAMPRGRRPFPAGASWSSTTTATPRTRSASC